MTDKQRAAYEWAKGHDYPSIAARHAQQLAGLVDDLMCAARDPLTTKELQRMIGEPVWLTGMEHGDAWARIDFVKPLTVGFSLFGDSETWCFRTSAYGKRVFAYRRKPEEVTP